MTDEQLKAQAVKVREALAGFRLAASRSVEIADANGGMMTKDFTASLTAAIKAATELDTVADKLSWEVLARA